MATVAGLFGASGLVGGHCLRLLLTEPGFEEVRAFGRRPIEDAPDPHDRLRQHVLDFDRLDAHADDLAVDAIVCALGTTMRKAGSREAFRRIDHGYPLRIAQLGLERGARHFLLVSAIGAYADSRVFYNRVKGELERDVRALGYPSLTIVRPSLLLGERREFRLGEELGKGLDRALGWLLPGRYRPVRAEAVARVLVHSAREEQPGTRVVESDEIRALAAGAAS